VVFVDRPALQQQVAIGVEQEYGNGPVQ
jgi:hypothetical protein